jgi:hypothetical protein
MVIITAVNRHDVRAGVDDFDDARTLAARELIHFGEFFC